MTRRENAQSAYIQNYKIQLPPTVKADLGESALNQRYVFFYKCVQEPCHPSSLNTHRIHKWQGAGMNLWQFRLRDVTR